MCERLTGNRSGRKKRKNVRAIKSVNCEASMRTVLKASPIISALLLFGGCQKPDPGPPNTARLIFGALQIRDSQERDAALATACRESAGEGAAPSVLMGIPRIEDSNLRDSVAEECAVILGDDGQTDAAIDVAKLISSESKRDELLAKLK
jgi:hypothetical protein